ncbi:XRE family transcriptional regulator [Paraburkholderia sp. A1RI_3L]|uniref:helix-turn-helix domain-containing protein n=1 Tax=Paraburkholderia TaxID=1822464 RepID=UPI003B761AF8
MMFIGSNLRTARLFHGLSLQELGERIDRSKQFLSRIEAGVDAPTPALVEAVCSELKVLPEFFTEPDPMPIADEQCHFRKQLTTKVALRQVARAKGELLKRMVNALEEYLDLPQYNFDEGDGSSAETIERAAEQARAHWELGLGPIQNMTRVAENAGAVVVPLNGLASEIDAISFATRRPVIGVNPEGRSACRTRFGIAHEVGHFFLHSGVQTGDKMTESQANRFASAFLMPSRYFAPECRAALRGSRLSWAALSEIKKRWGVSKAATLYRGRQLGVFSDEQYKSGVIGLTRHGEARVEVEDAQIEPEQPELVVDSVQVLQESFGISQADIAHQMRVQPSLLRELLSNQAEDVEISAGNVVRFPRSNNQRPGRVTDH